MVDSSVPKIHQTRGGEAEKMDARFNLDRTAAFLDRNVAESIWWIISIVL